MSLFIDFLLVDPSKLWSVGAVVIIEGFGSGSSGVRGDVFLNLVDSCGSEACLNFSNENLGGLATGACSDGSSIDDGVGVLTMRGGIAIGGEAQLFSLGWW